jgi:SAM-dependent methyltransferase
MQGELWNIAAHDWAQLQEPTHRPYWIATLAVMRVGKGTRFLDAGCGAGGASVLAAERGAKVTGIDAAPALLAIAREQVPTGQFRLGDLEKLPFADASFDAILAANSVQFTKDPVAALGELRRVCAAGGLVAVVSWGAQERCEWAGVFKAVVNTLPGPPPGEGPFALAAPGALEALLAKAELKIVSTGEVFCPFEYPSEETAWRALKSSGPLQGAIRAVGEEALRNAVVPVLRKFEKPDGSVRLNNVFRYVLATP